YPKELMHGTDDVAAAEADVKRWREMRAQGMSAKSPREFCDAWEKVFRFVLVGDSAHASRIQSHCDLENEWPANLDATMDSSMESLKKVEITHDQMKKITVTVLIIHGRRDRKATYESGRHWAAAVRNAVRVT